MEKKEFEMELLEKIVQLAWDEELLLNKVLLKLDEEQFKSRRASWCQGISNNIERRLVGIFQVSKFYIKVGEKSHVALMVLTGENDYIVDGSIKQFLPDEKRTVFGVDEYPLSKDGTYPELQTW